MRIAPILALAVGCAPVKAPDGIECNRTIVVKSDVANGLSQADSGSCVVLGEGTYSGPLQVPTGVKLVAAADAAVKITSSDEDEPAITLAGDGSTGIYGITVEDAGHNGVFVDGASAELSDVTITNAARAGLAISCEADCLDDGKGVIVDGVEVSGSTMGIWISGARVTVTNSTVKDNTSLSASGGWGVIAIEGAEILISDSSVDGNDFGLLVDGSQTTAELEDIEVIQNAERGIWLQNLVGTQSDPAFVLSGTNTMVEANGALAVGAFNTLGIIITNGWFKDTVSIPLMLDIDDTIDIGDGIGLFSSTGEVHVEGATFSNNARAQALVDTPSNAIDFYANTFDVAGGEYGVVVQNDTAAANPTFGQSTDTPVDPLGVPPMGITVPDP
ncbi:MAG: hypothetical protein HN348_19945 [Proteobacteria bacterium]|jgi:hypothetical protein|nr:hypothetical protein [Pseudomonadota bacterium]